MTLLVSASLAMRSIIFRTNVAKRVPTFVFKKEKEKRKMPSVVILAYIKLEVDNKFTYKTNG